MYSSVGKHYRFIAKGGATRSYWRTGLELQEELPGVAGGAACSHRTSGLDSQEERLESQEDRHGVTRKVLHRSRRGSLE